MSLRAVQNEAKWFVETPSYLNTYSFKHNKDSNYKNNKDEKEKMWKNGTTNYTKCNITSRYNRMLFSELTSAWTYELSGEECDDLSCKFQSLVHKISHTPEEWHLLVAAISVVAEHLQLD